MGLRRASRPLLLGCLAAVLVAARSGVAAPAPIPVKDLMEGFSASFLYTLSPDGRHVLRRRAGTTDLKVFPVSDGGEVGESFDLTRHRTWFSIWSRDGSRLYGIRSRGRSLVALAIDPAKPAARAREIPLSGIDGRVVRAGRHPAEDGRLLLWAYGRGGESILHCELNGGGCTSTSTSAGGSTGWRSVIDETGRPAARHRFAGTSFTFRSRSGTEWRTAGETPVDRILLPLTPVDHEGWGTALSNLTSDTVSLVRWNVRTLEERVVFSAPDADVQQALLSEAGEPLAVVSFPGYPRTTALHPAVERVLDLVRSGAQACARPPSRPGARQRHVRERGP